MSSLTNVEVETAGAAAEGAITFISWLSTADTPGNQAFVQNYNATFGRVPNAFAVGSYTAVYILAEAIKNAEATDAISIRNALANITDFDTVFGKFSFNADGDAVYAPGGADRQRRCLATFLSNLQPAEYHNDNENQF